ncbi:hypothetical protein CASFOL_032272 [Castilleja foliolosa]|uniref:Uncharacterized protein n=1 Tax=Castilleja foliolosa TaxID=1961234 RepID=A0ABD3C2R6_9LAMI
MAIPRLSIAFFIILASITSFGVFGDNTNHVYSPCADASVQMSDGFTFGIAFASKTAFSFNNSKLSPCDRRLSLPSANSQVAVFRPKVDEISLLTINTSNFFPDSYGGYMVAFAGRRYAARSEPAFVGNSTFAVTSFTLFMNLKKGGCKTHSGKEMDVRLAQADQISSA